MKLFQDRTLLDILCRFGNLVGVILALATAIDLGCADTCAGHNGQRGRNVRMVATLVSEDVITISSIRVL